MPRLRQGRVGLLQQQSAELMAQGRLAGMAAIVGAAEMQAREEFRSA